jgi:hypothetical protein
VGNGIVNKRWAFPTGVSADDDAADAAAHYELRQNGITNGAANGTHHHAAEPNKKL